MRSTTFLLALALAFVLPAAPAGADAPPAPRLDRVDHARPEAARVLTEKMGAGQRTQGLARQLAASGGAAAPTLGRMVRWMERNLREDPAAGRTWRPVDRILADGTLGGDADRALVLGALARAAGIPVAFVKTLPLAWLRAWRSRRQAPERPVGRTFLEVHLEGRWMLLDPETARLHTDYDPAVRLLPDEHVAYDKGLAPYDLVLSNRFDLWRAQVQAHGAGIALPEPPWSGGRDLLAPWRVYVTGAGSPATYAREAARTLGWLVEKTIRSDYERWLPEAAGSTPIVTLGADGPALPKRLWARYLGEDVARAFEAGRRPARPWLSRRLPDGTRVVLITVQDYGPVEVAVSEALEG